jgi:hypothetical protein
MRGPTSFIKICILLFGILTLSGMSGCPRESGSEGKSSDRGSGSSDTGGGGSDMGGGGGY